MCGTVIVFFKQKTAYEMRISDWSSDVCSSDLGSAGAAGFAAERKHALDQPVDISAAGAEIDDAHAQAVAAVERGRRQRDFSGGHQLCLYAGVDAIDRFRAGAVGPVAEAEIGRAHV